MPDPPASNIFTQHVLENPWPLGLILLAAGGFLLWSGSRDGLLKRMKVGGALGAVGAAILVIGNVVVTSGEHAKIVTRKLVNAATENDAAGALALFSPEAVFAFTSPKNPGFGFEFISTQLNRLGDRYSIDSNTITRLRGYSESSDVGVAHLACITHVQGIPTASRWVVRVKEQPSGVWEIVHLTCVAINDRPPPTEGLR